jgi:hypothetical protein
VRELSIDLIVEAGRTFNLRREMPLENIRSSLRDLFTELEANGVDYVLVGGVALLTFVEGRNTQDVDLIVDPAQAQRMPWNAQIIDRDLGKAAYRGIDVDLLLTTNPLFAEVRAQERTLVTFAERQIPAATRQGLLLLKLYALPSLYRQGEQARAALYETDILMLRQGANIDDEALLARLESHLARHDVDELRRILAEQRARVRFSE